MSFPRIPRFIATACILAWRTLNAHGQDGSLTLISSNPVPLPLQVSVRNEAIIGLQQIHRAYVSVGTNMFAFAVPDDFHVDSSNPSKVVLVQADYNCFLAMRVISPAPERESQPDFYRGLVLEEYPSAKIVAEFAQAAGPYNGPVYDLQWTNASRVQQSARVLFIPSRVGTIEMILLSRSEKFSDSKRFFDFLRSSYCTDDAGPIKPILAPKEPPRS